MVFVQTAANEQLTDEEQPTLEIPPTALVIAESLREVYPAFPRCIFYSVRDSA